MPVCFVSDCKNRRTAKRGVKLHPFPKDSDRLVAWLAAAGRDSGDLESDAERISAQPDSFHLCSDHFAPECYTIEGDRVVLCDGAVPTLFPKKKAKESPTEKNGEDLSDFERGMVIGAMQHCNFSVSKTAKLLGFSHAAVSKAYNEWAASQETPRDDLNFRRKDKM